MAELVNQSRKLAGSITRYNNWINTLLTYFGGDTKKRIFIVFEVISLKLSMSVSLYPDSCQKVLMEQNKWCVDWDFLHNTHVPREALWDLISCFESSLYYSILKSNGEYGSLKKGGIQGIPGGRGNSLGICN